jgi:hypothetical protein
MKAITLCVNRFDEETKMAFLDLYSKVDSSVESPANTSTTNVVTDEYGRVNGAFGTVAP